MTFIFCKHSCTCDIIIIFILSFFCFIFCRQIINNIFNEERTKIGKEKNLDFSLPIFRDILTIPPPIDVPSVAWLERVTKSNYSKRKCYSVCLKKIVHNIFRFFCYQYVKNTKIYLWILKFLYKVPCFF